MRSGAVGVGEGQGRLSRVHVPEARWKRGLDGIFRSIRPVPAFLAAEEGEHVGVGRSLERDEGVGLGRRTDGGCIVVVVVRRVAEEGIAEPAFFRDLLQRFAVVQHPDV